MSRGSRPVADRPAAMDFPALSGTQHKPLEFFMALTICRVLQVRKQRVPRTLGSIAVGFKHHTRQRSVLQVLAGTAGTAAEYQVWFVHARITVTLDLVHYPKQPTVRLPSGARRGILYLTQYPIGHCQTAEDVASGQLFFYLSATQSAFTHCIAHHHWRHCSHPPC